MTGKDKIRQATFDEAAERILSLEVEHRVNRLGGYGPNGEVIYEAHPVGCPSTLVDNQKNATATFTSNGSLDFGVKLEGGISVHVLGGSFDAVEKREIGVPSSNVWLEVARSGGRHVASIINPMANVNMAPSGIKVVKLGDPERAMWYCASFELAERFRLDTAVRLAMVYTAKGPAVTRDIYVKNRGPGEVRGNIWTYFGLHGTQRFVYNKELWYDAGLPVTVTETVTACTVPYEAILQIKRVSSHVENATPEESTCDYSTFIGDTSAFALNGEYHHAQVFMHRFRLNVPGQAGQVWRQFRPILSATVDESIAGPFDMPSNSYVADSADPHFGKGMYFGLSGSVDWIIEVFQRIVGLELALHDDRKPDVRINPHLPEQIRDALTFMRVIHRAEPGGGYRRIPLTIGMRRSGGGDDLSDTIIKVNGKQQPVAEVWDLGGVEELNIEILYVYR